MAKYKLIFGIRCNEASGGDQDSLRSALINVTDLMQVEFDTSIDEDIAKAAAGRAAARVEIPDLRDLPDISSEDIIAMRDKFVHDCVEAALANMMQYVAKTILECEERKLVSA